MSIVGSAGTAVYNVSVSSKQIMSLTVVPRRVYVQN